MIIKKYQVLCNRILDLGRFYDLKHLNCSNNKITKIINLNQPGSKLKHLNCSNNKISNLSDIPYNMVSMCYKSNPIVKLKFIGNFIPKKYPKKLNHLIFGKKFNQSVDNLPNTITTLAFGEDFNKLVNNLPNNITFLSLCYRFNQPVDNLPNSITVLVLGTPLFLPRL